MWEKRLDGDAGNDCLVSVDGTDFQIRQPTKFSKVWYSHKFKGPGLRYEVGVSIAKGKVVWIHRPFECGMWPDIKIFRDSLLSHLGTNERVEADDGYIGDAPRHLKCPPSFANPEKNKKMQSRVQSRHETANKRFKQWGCLKQIFCHDIRKHSDVFQAVAVITQIALQLGEPCFVSSRLQC